MSETRETMIRRAVVAMQESKAWPAVFRPETGRALAEAAVDAVAAPDLAEALEPFVALAAIFRDEPDDMLVCRPARGPEITLGYLRKARAALARAKGAS